MEEQEYTTSKKRVRLNPKPKIPAKQERQGETKTENKENTDCWRSEMQKKIEDLSEIIKDLKKTNEELKIENEKLKKIEQRRTSSTPASNKIAESSSEKKTVEGDIKISNRFALLSPEVDEEEKQQQTKVKKQTPEQWTNGALGKLIHIEYGENRDVIRVWLESKDIRKLLKK